MTIDFSEEQFRALLDLVYAGNWMMNANREEDTIQEYEDLQSHVFSKCAEFGCGKFAEKYRSEYCPSAAFDETGIMDRIDEYTDDTMFEALAEELAYRDAPENLDKEKLGDFIEAQYDRYLKEFSDNGLEHVSVNPE